MTAERISPPPLRRTFEGRMLAGVADGLARHFDLELSVVRIAIVVLALMGPGIPLYVAAWLLIPEEGTESCVLSELMDSTRAA